MQSKLSRTCDGILEAGWLAAVIVVPVFFNVYSARIFEPDKLTLLRTLALVVLAAWIVKLIDQGGVRWETIQKEGAGWRTLLRVPLLAPVAALAVVYILSTLFSVSPATSLWGSYQRLQGTYTTFSYLVIFAAIAANLRRRPQVERLLTAVILSSLPVSLYGILQRYGIDPIPWGGNVTARITANMGNSIFVAAYLIMAFPAVLVRILDSFGAILKDREGLWPNFARATVYVFIAVLQLIALFFSGSRGPWIGWGVSLIFMGLGLSLVWKKRWLAVAGVGVGAAALAFLFVLNMPDGPLQGLRQLPGVGRLGQIFDTESRTGQVRSLIWQGASELVKTHAPLEFPDGRKDRFNFLRPVIGYGPESMYVAYNRFYPPALTRVEMRNASPDRSHNETWDSLVFTGALGLGVYLALFGSLFYYGLKWLGVIAAPRQRNLFIGLYVGGGILSAAAAILWKGIGYFGVGLPVGMIGGVVLYLILAALSGRYSAPQSAGEMTRALTLIALLGTLVAHFVEINFGIAIAATRTYFWITAALLLVVGYILPTCGAYEQGAVQEGSVQEGRAQDGRAQGALAGRVPEGQAGGVPARRKSRSGKPAARSSRRARTPKPAPGWLWPAMTSGLVLAVLLVTLGYNYISVAQGGTSAPGVIWSSLTRLKSSANGSSMGLLSLALTTWLIGGVVLSSERILEEENLSWGKLLAGILGISLGAAFLFWLWHAGSLAGLIGSSTQTVQDVLELVGRYENHLTRYYTYLLLLILGLAAVLPPAQAGRPRPVGNLALAAAPLLGVAVIALAAYTNLRVIQADIAFKLAEPFARGATWPVSIEIYKRAIAMAPSEDYYYLFLGRAYFEQAKTINDPAEREQLMARAARDLKQAQEINPLNIDHTANLARLHSLWAVFAQDPEQRAEKRDLSNEYFAKAVMLSPNNAKLWDEWALLYLNVYGQPDEAYQRISHALELDPYYDYTQLLMAEYYAREARDLEDVSQKAGAVEQAVFHYREAARLAPDAATRANYLLALAQLYIDQEQPDQAIVTIEEALNLIPGSPDLWKYEQMLAQLYAQIGDKVQALEYANRALSRAPEQQKTNVQNLIAQIESMP